MTRPADRAPLTEGRDNAACHYNAALTVLLTLLFSGRLANSERQGPMIPGPPHEPYAFSEHLTSRRPVLKTAIALGCAWPLVERAMSDAAGDAELNLRNPRPQGGERRRRSLGLLARRLGTDLLGGRLTRAGSLRRALLSPRVGGVGAWLLGAFEGG